jgi:large subunit ribosomal protein L22
MQKIVFAKNKYNLTSAQKARLVIALIRGKPVLEAIDILRFTNKAVSKDVLKTLNSAVANCVHNNQWNKKDLMVQYAVANEAPTYKRGRPTARGRYHQILKRNCHIIIGLENKAVKEDDAVPEKVNKTIAKEKVVEKKSVKKVNKVASKEKKEVVKKANK